MTPYLIKNTHKKTYKYLLRVFLIKYALILDDDGIIS
jgi:hypothetical protein